MNTCRLMASGPDGRSPSDRVPKPIVLIDELRMRESNTPLYPCVKFSFIGSMSLAFRLPHSGGRIGQWLRQEIMSCRRRDKATSFCGF